MQSEKIPLRPVSTFFVENYWLNCSHLHTIRDSEDGDVWGQRVRFFKFDDTFLELLTLFTSVPMTALL